MAMQTGGCHCGRVRFEVDGAPDEVVECNCSICSRKAYLHWIVPRAAFRIVAGEDHLATYRFGTGVAQHRFCCHCGVASFYVPRSHPDGIDVNARCLDGVDAASLPRRPFDGRNWEQSVGALRGAVPGDVVS
jgi:centromere protein V